MVVAIVLGPSLDSIVCRQEAEIVAQPAAISVNETATQDGSASYPIKNEALCAHGHCHHATPYVAPQLQVAALQATPRTRHTPPRGRVVLSDPKFELNRPPRA